MKKLRILFILLVLIIGIELVYLTSVSLNNRKNINKQQIPEENKNITQNEINPTAKAGLASDRELMNSQKTDSQSSKVYLTREIEGVLKEIDGRKRESEVNSEMVVLSLKIDTAYGIQTLTFTEKYAQRIQVTINENGQIRPGELSDLKINDNLKIVNQYNPNFNPADPNFQIKLEFSIIK